LTQAAQAFSDAMYHFNTIDDLLIAWAAAIREKKVAKG